MGLRKPYVIALLAALILFFTVQVYSGLAQVRDLQDELNRQKQLTQVAPVSKTRWQASELIGNWQKAQGQFTISAPDLTFNAQTGHHLVQFKGKPANLLAFYRYFEKKAQVGTITHMTLEEAGDDSTLSVEFLW